jgi:Glyoxalase-like domain
MSRRMWSTRARAVLSVSVAMNVACASAQRTQDASGFVIDHVIVAIDSLERGIALLRDATGLTPVFGGAHPGRGTQNALLSLGSGSYLELLAPNPADEQGQRMVAMFAAARRLTPSGWALTARDADSVRALAITRGLPAGVVAAGSRGRPDGSTLRWRTLNPWGWNNALLPFFIEWHATSPHPSAESPRGCTLASVTLHSTSADSLRQLFQRMNVQATVLPAERDAMSLTLDCPKGPVRLGDG